MLVFGRETVTLLGVGGWVGIIPNSLGISMKGLPITPAILLLGTYLVGVLAKWYMSMIFIAALFVNGGHIRGPLVSKGLV